MDNTVQAHVDPESLRVLPPKGLLICIAAQLPAIALAWPLAPGALALGAAAALVALALALNLWADALFRRDGAGVCPFTPVRSLVTRGPFRVTRNPMYVGLVLAAFAPAVGSGTAIGLWAPVAYAMWLHYRFVLPEEAFLRGQFGARFDAWAARIPRWIGLRARRSFPIDAGQAPPPEAPPRRC